MITSREVKLFKDILLHEKYGADARNYLLKKREFNAYELANCFDVGWCPKFVNYKYRNRLIFPIYDSYGCLVANHSRLLCEKGNWLHDKFDKRYFLYGLNWSKEHIISSKHVIIVEGIFDYFRLFCNGIKNVVATLGSALTREHIISLLRYTDSIFLFFDNDEAGDSSNKKSTKIIRKIDNNAKIGYIKYKDNVFKDDPDLYIYRNGVSVLRSQISDFFEKRNKKPFSFKLEIM